MVGPHKLPEMAKKLARILREVRKTSDEFQASFLRDTGSDVRGFISNPQGSIKRHLENEVKEVLEGKDVSSVEEEQATQEGHSEDDRDHEKLVAVTAERSAPDVTWKTPPDDEVVARTSSSLESKEGIDPIG